MSHNTSNPTTYAPCSEEMYPSLPQLSHPNEVAAVHGADASEQKDPASKDPSSASEVTKFVGKIMLIPLTLMGGGFYGAVRAAENAQADYNRVAPEILHAIGSDGFKLVPDQNHDNKVYLHIEGDVGAPKDKGEVVVDLQVGRCSVANVQVDLYTTPNGTVDATDYILPPIIGGGNNSGVTIPVKNVEDAKSLSNYQDCFAPIASGIGG